MCRRACGHRCALPGLGEQKEKEKEKGKSSFGFPSSLTHSSLPDKVMFHIRALRIIDYAPSGVNRKTCAGADEQIE